MFGSTAVMSHDRSVHRSRADDGSLRRILAALSILLAGLPSFFVSGLGAAEPSRFQFADEWLSVDVEVPVPFQVVTDVPFSGYVVSATYDPSVIEIARIESASVVQVEYFNFQVLPEEGRFTFQALADALPPFDGQEFPATGGNAETLAMAWVGISGPGPDTTAIRFADGLGDPPIVNGFMVGADLVAPDGRIDGTLRIPLVFSQFLIADTTVIPGEPNAVPFQVTIGYPFRGLRASIAYDPAVIQILGVDSLEWTAEEYFNAEVLPLEGRLTIEILASPDPAADGAEFGGHSSPATIANVLVDVTSDLGPSTSEMRLVDGLGDPPVVNRFYLESGDQAPDVLFDGTLTIKRMPSSYRFGDATILRGQRGSVPLQVVTDIPFQGLSVSAAYDPEVITIPEISFVGTTTEAIGAEYSGANVYPGQGGITIGVLVDALPPFEDRLFPGTGLPLTVAQVTVEALDLPGPPTTSLSFVDGMGTVPARNLLSIDNRAHAVEVLTAGTIAIPRPPYFIRGDVNQRHGVDLSDAIYLLNFLFRGGRAIPCLVAADANDDEGVDLGDAIYVVQYCFLGGPPPPAPFPLAGSDPTKPEGSPELGCVSPVY